MNRLVGNEHQRRKALKELFKDDPKIDVKDDRTFYIPKHFKKEIIESKNPKEGNSYKYTPLDGKYWAERATGTWENTPKIFDDDCKEFYQ